MDCFVVAFLAMTNGGLQASSQRKHKTKNPAAFAAGFFQFAHVEGRLFLHRSRHR